MKTFAIRICQCLGMLFLLCHQIQSEPLFLQEDVLSKDRLTFPQGLYFLSEGWKYHPGDRTEWADPTFDDTNWDTIAAQSEP